ncbi:MAG: glycosyltransferase, partial [Planctomycetota bacterium]
RLRSFRFEEKMKIVHVVHCFPPEPVGGTERVVASLVQGLSQRGHDLHVIAGSLDWEKGFRVEREIYKGIPVTRIHRDDPWFDRWDNGYHPGVERIYQDLLQELKPDLVHIHHWIRLTRNLAQLTQAAGIPSVVQLHDFHATCPRTFRLTPDRAFCDKTASLERCLQCVKRWPFQGDAEVSAHIDQYTRDMQNELRCAHGIFTLSEAQALFVASVLPTQTGGMRILPPGTPAELSARSPRTSSHTLRLIHWGNLFDLKGVMLLVEAVALAREQVPIELKILGRATQPEFKAKLEMRVQGLPITLCGEYVWQDLQACDADLAVFPSLCYETYSLVVDEALMLGLPVIVSDLGAPAERIGRGGIAVPTGDVRALADQLIRLARNREALANLAAGVRRCGTSREEAAARAEKYYQGFLNGEGNSLPLERPVSIRERLTLSWFTAGQRLLSLAGSDVSHPPMTGTTKTMKDYLKVEKAGPLTSRASKPDSIRD